MEEPAASYPNAPQTPPWRTRFLAGLRDCIPVALSVIAYGLVFGVLAREKGLGPLAVLAMSGLVFSGAAQFVALGLWGTPLAFGPIVLATAIVSLRYLLICASCRPLFAGTGRRRALAAMFLVSDENWAMTMGAEAARRPAGAAHLLGGGVLVYLAWMLSTAAGSALGTLIADPARWGLDFAFTAAFLAMLVGTWRGSRDLGVWLVAAVAAVAASRLFPGQWYILAGGLAGSLAGVVRARA
ncbi:MAG: AzlC family ABC transporter permease [Alphaproteobacteria bacterium]|nr:AzlC family ABC transporter permease [Alphaproteobacteria bacterium]